jgi:hypothetical protein
MCLLEFDKDPLRRAASLSYAELSVGSGLFEVVGAVAGVRTCAQLTSRVQSRIVAFMSV